MSTVNKFSDLH